jgi:hypothetical protein
MTPSSPASNVYYLTPPVLAAARPARPAPGRILHLRLRAFWWRLRIAAADVMAAHWRVGRTPLEAAAAFLEQRANLVLAVPSRRRAGPARIIDFAAARTRLRA